MALRISEDGTVPLELQVLPACFVLLQPALSFVLRHIDQFMLERTAERYAHRTRIVLVNPFLDLG